MSGFSSVSEVSVVGEEMGDGGGDGTKEDSEYGRRVGSRVEFLVPEGLVVSVRQTSREVEGRTVVLERHRPLTRVSMRGDPSTRSLPLSLVSSS